MQRIIDNFPEFKKGERNTSKHFHILEELRKIVDGRKLYEKFQKLNKIWRLVKRVNNNILDK
jgi:hypothetical protein